MGKYCQAVQSRLLKPASAILALLLARAAFCQDTKTPPDPAAAARDAVELSNRGDLQAAKIRFEQAITLDPGNATLHQGLGLVCIRLHLFDEAQTTLEKAVSLNAKLPAAQIHVAEFDPLRDEGEAYAAALTAAGGRSELTVHAGLIHHFYGLGGVVPAAQAAFGRICDGLKRAWSAKA